MNSPWGIEFAAIKDLRCTREYLLWQVSWLNVQIMRRDAPGFKTGKKKPAMLETEADFDDFLKR